MIHIKRIFRHLLSAHWQVRRAFPRRTLLAIEAEIGAGEARHIGELRFVVEGALSGAPLYKGQSSRERAIDVFSELRIWDTDERNGVLIYLLMADRSVEIVADRGVNAKAGEAEWTRICGNMERVFREGRYEQGAVEGIQAVSALLAAHFPANGGGHNELSDKVVVL
jgi:uncharacterized membrane protein